MTYLFFSLFLGDRYWYENDIPPSSFTKEQLNEIRKVKLAQVICENIPSIDFVQPNAFLESDPFLNALMPCRGETILHTLNLNAWATGKIFAYFVWNYLYSCNRNPTSQIQISCQNWNGFSQILGIRWWFLKITLIVSRVKKSRNWH